jgi:ssDNA-binding Zn-finger/Zn-ribbon topoisomerase 1
VSLKDWRERIFAAAREAQSAPLCPKCGVARMTEFHGRKGWFWQCRRFPECRGAMGMSRADKKRAIQHRNAREGSTGSTDGRC